MSKADDLFVSMCTDILENGTTTEGQKVRPHWEDGAPAYTIKQFGVVNRYDLRDEFPALTLRRTALKSCMDEVLWIYQRKSNNIHDLKSHIWDEWADETGSIGKAYGYQIAQKSRPAAQPMCPTPTMPTVLPEISRPMSPAEVPPARVAALAGTTLRSTSIARPTVSSATLTSE